MSIDTTLQQRLDEVPSILTSGDPGRTGELYTRDGWLIPPESDFVTGRDAIADFWQELLDMGVDTVNLEPVELEDFGDAVMRIGRASLHDATGTTMNRVKFIEIWKHADGEWRIHADIWNDDVAEGQ